MWPGVMAGARCGANYISWSLNKEYDMISAVMVNGPMGSSRDGVYLISQL